MTYLDQLLIIAGRLPAPVLQDINGRILDWIASGGGPDDPYIQQQLRYAERFVIG